AAAAEAAHWRLPAKVVVAVWHEAESGAADAFAPAVLVPATRPTLSTDALRAAHDGVLFAIAAAPSRDLRAALAGRAAGIGPAVAPGEAARSFRLATAAL